MNNLLSCHLCHHLGSVLIIQLGFGLSLKPGIRVFDGNNSCHTVSYIRPGKINILILQNIQFTGVCIDYIGKLCFKACQMGSALGIIYIIAKAQNIFMKLVYVLQGNLYRDSITFTGKINDIMNGFLGFIQILDKSHNPVRLMENDGFRFLLPLILKMNGQGRIQISCFMQSALNLIFLKTCFIKNSIIRQKIYGSTGFFCLSDHRKKTINQFQDRNSLFIAVLIDKPTGFYRNCQLI